MFNILSLFKRFLPPYKKYIAGSLLFNLLATIFSLFSFAAIIPVLQILFNLKKLDVAYMPWMWSDSLTDLIAAFKNNFSYWLTTTITSIGPTYLYI